MREISARVNAVHRKDLSWTKEHAKFVGRMIFADFIELSLIKYKDFIENAAQHFCESTESPFFSKLQIDFKRLSRAKISRNTVGYSPKVVAEIGRKKADFFIRYTYECFNKIYLIDKHLGNKLWDDGNIRSILFRLRRIGSRNALTHAIIKGIIEHQKEFLRTGDPMDLVTLSQV